MSCVPISKGENSLPLPFDSFSRLSESLCKLIKFALVIICMKEVFCLLRARFTKVILVERLNFWIEMAHADNTLLVIGV